MLVEISEKDFTKKGNNFYINKAEKTGGMLMVKAEWCSHCKRALPIMEDVSKTLGSAYKMFKLDADADPKMVDNLGVKGFPTILYINRDGMITKKYEGERSPGEILSGICKESLVCKR